MEIEAKEELLKELGEKNKKLLTLYSIAIENKLDYVYHNLSIKILNLGIKIGIDLQKAFAEDEQ